MGGAFGGGHQRQVIERQRPARPAGLDERQPGDPALVKLVEQQPIAGAVATVVIGQHALGCPFAVGVGADGEHEHVVGERVAVLGDHAVLFVLDAVKRAMVPASVEFGRGVLQPDAARTLALERLVDGHRAIDELQLRREDRDVDPICSKRTQRQQGLQARDPAARDEHARTAHDLADTMARAFGGIGGGVCGSGGGVAMTAMIGTRSARRNGHQCPNAPTARRIAEQRVVTRPVPQARERRGRGRGLPVGRGG